jgi:WD40 repeat protein
MMAFQPGAPVLIAVDAKNAITVFDLIKKQRLFVRNARSVVTCIELLSGSNWLFHGLKDGSIDVFDVYRGQPVPYRIPNILPEGSKHSLVISIKTHPTDSNQLLIAYNTGVVLWNLKLKTVVRAFIYEIPPGAMGGIAVGEGSGVFGMNESRYPHVTVISWKPDGVGFVSGYDDGCFVFWDITQERPVLARTIHEIQVNVPGIKPVFERATNQFVPIYQLTWCLHENREDTTLIVAGGTGSIDMFGLHLFDYPAKADYRRPKRHQVLTMDTDLLDFLVVPRSSPWYGGAFDPIAILVLTSRGGVKAFEFGQSNAPRTIPACLSLVEPRLILSKVYGPLPQELYYELIQGHTRIAPPPRVPLHGMRLAPVDESRLSKDILVTAHDDHSIRFWESASNRPLHHLTVELASLFFKNQGEIVAFEFSIQSQVLAVGFSNGSWIYTRITKDAALSRNSVARTVQEESADALLAGHMEHASITPGDCPSDNVVRGGADISCQSVDIKHIQSQPTSPHQPHQSLQHDTTSPKDATTSPWLPQAHELVAAAAPESTPVAPAPAPLLDIQAALAPGPRAPHVIPPTADKSDALSPVPDDADLDYLIPYSPVEKVTIRDLPPGGLIPSPAGPERAPSPSLPPRPQFIEATLPTGSDFSVVFKSSAQLGRIRSMAVSACGLYVPPSLWLLLFSGIMRTKIVTHTLTWLPFS